MCIRSARLALLVKHDSEPTCVFAADCLENFGRGFVAFFELV